MFLTVDTCVWCFGREHGGLMRKQVYRTKTGYVKRCNTCCSDVSFTGISLSYISVHDSSLFHKRLLPYRQCDKHAIVLCKTLWTVSSSSMSSTRCVSRPPCHVLLVMFAPTPNRHSTTTSQSRHRSEEQSIQIVHRPITISIPLANHPRLCFLAHSLVTGQRAVS